MRTRQLSILLVALFACAGLGCTIAAQMQDNEQTQQRIDVKGHDLETQTVTNAELHDEMAQLNGELSDKTTTSRQLDASLARLQDKNKRLKADTDGKRRQQDALAAELSRDRAELAALNQTNAKTDEQIRQQRAQYDELKARIRGRLVAIKNSG